MTNGWNNTKPNPFSFKRCDQDGAGRVWSWQYCKDEDCTVCWVTDEEGNNIKPVTQQGQELFLLNCRAWLHDHEIEPPCSHYECANSGKAFA